LGDVQRVRVVVDKGRDLALTHVEVIDCARSDAPGCMTDEAFRALVLPATAANDHEYLLSLLDWASNTADFAVAGALAERTAVYVNGLSARQMYASVYKPNRGGGFCGAHAQFMANLLREFGYDALTMDVGVPGTTLTHVTTLVYLDGQFFMLDPTFNAYVTRADGEWATLVDILEEPAALQVNSRLTPGRDFLTTQRPRPGDTLTNCRRGGDLFACRREGYSLDTFLVDQARAMAAHGFAPTRQGFLAMVGAHVFSISGGSPEARAALAALLAQHGLSSSSS
jgi:hypothetical protein